MFVFDEGRESLGASFKKRCTYFSDQSSSDTLSPMRGSDCKTIEEISGMWLAAMMTRARRSDEAARHVDNQAAKVRRSWKAYAAPVLIKPKTSGSGTVER
jgi:hypothetical protein